MRSIKIIYKNGREITTSINGTKETIKEYYMGKFSYGMNEIVTDIIFLTKSIKELWDETPQGEAIKDYKYQEFCRELEKKTARTIKQMAAYNPEIWNFDCNHAIEYINYWAEKQKKLEPNYLENYKRDCRLAEGFEF